MKPYVPIIQLQDLVLSTSLPIPPANYFEAKLRNQFISSVSTYYNFNSYYQCFPPGVELFISHQRYTIRTLATTFSVNIC